MFNSFKTLFVVCVLCLTPIVAAQTFTPTEAQLEQFKRLSPDQQEQLARQMGINLDDLMSDEDASLTNKRQTTDFVDRGPTEEEKQAAMFEQLIAEQLKRDDEEEEEPLKPFGYELFASGKINEQTTVNIPVPVDYILGPNDTLRLQLIGKETGSFELIINSEGNVDLPDLGPVSLSGATFQESKKIIEAEYSQRKIGVTPFVSMGELRTIQIFLVGEVFSPGTFLVSSLSTITSALFNSGGVNELGSLRNIELKRSGKTISNFDFYDLILRGNTAQDMRLQQGDVIFVPTVSNMIAIEGEVRRPALYELLEGETIETLLKFAGGTLPEANSNAIQIVRSQSSSGLSILNVNTANKRSLDTVMMNGDAVNVPVSNKEFTNAIKVTGALDSPSLVSVSQNPRLSNIVTSRGMMNNTDGDYGLVVRRGKLQRNTEIYQFSPIEVLKGNEDLDLQALDEIMLFERVSVVQEDYESSLEDEQNLELKQEESELLQEQVTMRFTRQELSIDKDGDFSRQTLLEPLIARLKSEASESNQVKLVEITGQVRYPGTYPLSNKQTVRDMLVAAGGLIESAHLDTAQITSLQITNGESNIEHNTINLMDEISGVSTTQLRSKDVLNVLRVPDWYQNNTVELAGEIVFPGKYQIKKGETLSELIERAGGLTDKATADAAVFTRLELKEKEKQNIQKAVEDLKQQLANSNLSSNQFSKTVDYQNAKEILDELTDIEPIGRLIIDLSAVISKTNSLPIELKDGDKLIVPNITPAISIIGEVFVPSTHAYRPESTIEDYLAKAGGVKEYGDSSKMYIVRANGSVYVPQKNYWFSSNEVQALQPGDTIILPREVNDYSNIGLWQGVTQIIYQTAIALSAINSF